MAKITKLVDDIDGSDATDTLEFSWGGDNYTIDLCDENADKFREIMALYVGSATKVRHDILPAAKRAVRTKKELDEIRAWARERGLQVAPTGRIREDVLTAYEARNEAVTEELEDDTDDAEREVLARLNKGAEA